MYIFGVYECVFSVVAVGWQPILCKGLKQTIIQSSWIRQTEEATSIDDTANHNPHFSGAIIYSVDYSSTFSFLLTLLLFYQPKATSGFVYYFIWKIIFSKCHPDVRTVAGSATRLAESDSVEDGSSASVTCFLVTCSSGLTAEQGTLSCVVSRTSLKSNWESFDCDSTRRLWVRLLSGGHIFKDGPTVYLSHQTFIFLSFWITKDC